MYKNKIKIESIVFWIVPILQLFMLEIATGKIAVLPWLVPLNLLFYYFLFMSILYCIKNKGITIIISSVIWFIIGIINNIVMQCRENPILPGDILSINTGLSVISNYDIKINSGIIFSLLFFLLLILVGIANIKQKITIQPLKQIIISVLSVVLLIGSMFFVQIPSLDKIIPMHYITFELDIYYGQNGFCLSFFRLINNMDIKKPNDYDSDTIEKELSKYKTDYKETDIKPNVIVIMNEAYSDLSSLGSFKTNIPYNSFVSSLSKNTYKGKLYTSVRGGNTANTEFEMLTGHSMAFFSGGSVPYQQAIRGDTDSVVKIFNENNYDTYAMHPYYAAGWSRDKAYDYLGFKHKVFAEDIYKQNLIDIKDEQNLCRYYISDSATYKYIMKQYEERDKSKGFFNFTVTMQNHGGYDEDISNGFAPDIFIEGMENDYPISTYLSLIKRSDDAFKELIEYFSNIKEPTIILMFGDHQPAENFVSGLIDYTGEDCSSNLKNISKVYEVPYILWSNYEIDVDAPEVTSANYLGEILLDAADINTSGYFAYLKELRKEYPIITGNFIADKNGKYDTAYNNDALAQYQKYAYYTFKNTQ